MYEKHGGEKIPKLEQIKNWFEALVLSQVFLIALSYISLQAL